MNALVSNHMKKIRKAARAFLAVQNCVNVYGEDNYRAEQLESACQLFEYQTKHSTFNMTDDTRHQMCLTFTFCSRELMWAACGNLQASIIHIMPENMALRKAIREKEAESRHKDFARQKFGLFLADERTPEEHKISLAELYAKATILWPTHYIGKEGQMVVYADATEDPKTQIFEGAPAYLKDLAEEGRRAYNGRTNWEDVVLDWTKVRDRQALHGNYLEDHLFDFHQFEAAA
jgi:hypothetical protein